MARFSYKWFRSWALAALWMAFIIVFDQAIKVWALENISQMNSPFFPYGGTEVARFTMAGRHAIDIALVVAFNTGAAWNFLEDYPSILIVIRSLLVIFLALWLWRSKGMRKWPVLTLIAGACSNLGDMVFRGAVVDMISFTFWGYTYPIFNIADIMICLGALIFILLGSTRGEASDVSNKHS